MHILYVKYFLYLFICAPCTYTRLCWRSSIVWTFVLFASKPERSTHLIAFAITTCVGTCGMVQNAHNNACASLAINILHNCQNASVYIGKFPEHESRIIHVAGIFNAKSFNILWRCCNKSMWQHWSFRESVGGSGCIEAMY